MLLIVKSNRIKSIPNQSNKQQKKNQTLVLRLNTTAHTHEIDRSLFCLGYRLNRIRIRLFRVARWKISRKSSLELVWRKNIERCWFASMYFINNLKIRAIYFVKKKKAILNNLKKIYFIQIQIHFFFQLQHSFYRFPSECFPCFPLFDRLCNACKKHFNMLQLYTRMFSLVFIGLELN